MPHNDLDSIAADMQDAIHRAYALGKSDALRRVVEMVQADELGSKAVALLGPAEPKADPLMHAVEASAPHAEAAHAHSDEQPNSLSSSSQAGIPAGPQAGEPAHNDNDDADSAPDQSSMPWYRRVR